MTGQKAIEHSGYIEEINDTGVNVKFISQSACASCHAKGACSAADIKDKEVFIKGNPENYHKGEQVKILMSMTQGRHAVLLGYVYPLVLFVFALLILNSTSLPELKAGLFALSSIIFYYILIYLFRNKINRKFSFSIRKYE